MKLNEKFMALGRNDEKALIAYVSAGDPDPESTINVVNALIKGGADIIELGIPFSDPIADGMTIQRASERALTSGMNTDIYFDICKQITADIPLVALTYYNIILQYGLNKFAKECSKSGIEGIIIPDLPVEESKAMLDACKDYKIDLIFMIAQTTTDDRMQKILEGAGGFIYLVSLLGVTGAREQLDIDANQLVERVKKKTGLPLCLGFGISKPSHVASAIGFGVDGVIVGSAIVDIIEKNIKNERKMLDELKDFVKRLKKNTKKIEVSRDA